jgi:hypothetical protein
MIDYGSSDLDIRPGGKGLAQNALTDVRNKLSDALKQQVPGYADATAKAQSYFDIRDALNWGNKDILGSQSAWPETVQSTFEAQSPAAQEATRAGVLSDIGRRVGTNPNDLAALRRVTGGDLDWNRANMGTVFGPENTRNFVRDVGNEQTFANTNQKVMGNSETAARTASAKNVEQAQLPPFSQVAAVPTMYGDVKRLALALANKGYETLRGGYHGQKLGELANVMTAPDSPYRQALIQALMAGQGAAGRAGQAISGAISNPALISALMSQGRPAARAP